MTSLLFGRKRQSNIDYKSRLEYKLYLARENPEPVFDLSECNLKTVPSGIYSLCKVFRKEKLSLQNNQLTSLSGGGQLGDLCLLVQLELQFNNLYTIPEEISLLVNLQVLNVSHNKLCKLPEGIGRLKELRMLDCAHNNLIELPSAMGGLSALTHLNLRNNPALKHLPSILGGAVSLQQLVVDSDTLQSPPSSVTTKGTSAILQYLCLQSGTSYVPVPNCRPQESEDYSKLQGSFNLLEKKKEDKIQELKEIERMLQEKKGREFELHENTKQDKNKLLLRLLEQQQKTEEDVSRFQTQKEQDRARLLNYLLKVESQAEETINDLLAVTQAFQRSNEWQQQDLKEQQLLSNIKQHTVELRRTQVIDAMEKLLAEEYARKEKIIAYENSKAEVIKNSLLKEVEWSKQLCELVRERDIRQTALLETIHADTQLHKALVATLLERSDLRTQSLLVQTSLVQQQLAALTAAELQSRDQHSIGHVNELAEKRQRLSEMLIELLQQQEDRRNHLVHTLHELEAACSTQVSENSPDYWLWQYQCLLDLKVPHLATTSLEPDLVHQLVASGVAHCLPFLACCSLTTLTSELLVKVGVKNDKERAIIMQVVEDFLTRKELAPSAPPEELPSAPPLSSPVSLPECIVCMSLECAVVFVPCGHLCVCAGCAAQLSLCPLCRASLDRKIHIIVP